MSVVVPFPAGDRPTTPSQPYAQTPRLSCTSPPSLNSSPTPSEALGNKLQRLAVLSPVRLRDIEKLVDRHLAELT